VNQKLAGALNVLKLRFSKQQPCFVYQNLMHLKVFIIFNRALMLVVTALAIHGCI
jgi:hypothetical protein